MKILIASPSYDGAVRKEYMRSVMALTADLQRQGIAWELCLETGTQLHVLRSVMASKAWLDETISHLLFIDTDMGFDATAIRRLIGADRAVIGCAYPYRSLPLQAKVPAGLPSLRALVSALVPYSVGHRPGLRALQVTEGICEVQSIGTGLLLIRRDVLETLVEQGQVRRFRNHFPYSQWYTGDTYHGFFEHLVESDAYLGEDVSFCRRWVNGCGGQIHAVVDQEILHVGPTPVLGRYSDRLQTGQL